MAIFNVLVLFVFFRYHSYTFDKVNERTDQHWHYLRYFIIREYHDRPPLVPPLIILAHLYLLGRRLLSLCCHGDSDDNNMFSECCVL